MTRPAIFALCALVLWSCSPGASQGRPAASHPSPSPQTSGPASGDTGFVFDAPLPRRAPALARELEEVTRALKHAIKAWVAAGTRPGDAARPVLLRAVRQQRIYRSLLDRPRLSRDVLRLLPSRLAAFAENTVRAGTQLRSLVSPLDRPPDWKIHKPAPARELLRYYKLGERRFDVPWQVLASINFVESRFGRILGPSSAGARGPMQFMPATWGQYGAGGDINDPRDSIVAAARYLSASGAPERMRDALFAYNRSDAYVRAILIYAKQMTKDPTAFYAYYHWQVYVLTKDGDLQLSGPGAAKS